VVCIALGVDRDDLFWRGPARAYIVWEGQGYMEILAKSDTSSEVLPEYCSGSFLLFSTSSTMVRVVLLRYELRPWTMFHLLS
jgi:hypothetical protein